MNISFPLDAYLADQNIPAKEFYGISLSSLDFEFAGLHMEYSKYYKPAVYPSENPHGERKNRHTLYPQSNTYLDQQVTTQEALDNEGLLVNQAKTDSSKSVCKEKRIQRLNCSISNSRVSTDRAN